MADTIYTNLKAQNQETVLLTILLCTVELNTWRMFLGKLGPFVPDFPRNRANA